MTKKQEVTMTEARILVYLSIVHNTRKHVTAISTKLDIGYSYLLIVLRNMTLKGWLQKHQYRRHMFYYLSDTAPLESAKKCLLDDALQHSLLEDKYTLPEILQEIEIHNSLEEEETKPHPHELVSSSSQTPEQTENEPGDVNKW